MRKTELFSNVPVASRQMARATVELLLTRDTVSTQSNELASVAQFRSSIERLENKVVFYEASEEELENELSAEMKDSTRVSQLVDDVRAEVVDLREGLSGKSRVIWSIVKDLCESLGTVSQRLG